MCGYSKRKINTLGSQSGISISQSLSYLLLSSTGQPFRVQANNTYHTVLHFHVLGDLQPFKPDRQVGGCPDEMQTLARENYRTTDIIPGLGILKTNEMFGGYPSYRHTVNLESSTESIGQRSQEYVSSQSLSLRYRPLFREFLAEFLGTFILMAFGTGAQSQYLLSQGKLATSISANCTWGIGVIMGVYVSGGVSGGHLNPAVSVALAVLGRLPWRKVPFYILAQCFGSLCACAVVYFVYLDALNHFDGGARHVEGMNATAAIWATYPQPYVSTWTALGDQIFSTALLLICVLGVSDPRNMSPSSGLFPISIGLIVMGLGMAFNLNCGNAMNPARDFIPRVFTIIAGWGSEPLNYRGYNWFWVNIVGPHFGAVLGALIYQIFIGMNWPPTSSCDVPIGYTQTEPGYTQIERGYIQTQSCYTQTERGYMQTEPRYTQTECGYIQTQPGYTQTEPLSGMSRV